MRLRISQFDGNSPSAYLKWFLSNKDTEQIQTMQEPVIVISITNGYWTYRWDTIAKEEVRMAVPIEKGGCFVSFRNPGRAYIYAEIFDRIRPYCGTYHIDEFLSIDRKYNGYTDYKKNARLIYDGKDIQSTEDDYFQRIEKSTLKIEGRWINMILKKRLALDVDPKLFAPKPRDWKLVNRWFDKPAENEFQFRSRRFVAYPYILLFFLFYYPFVLIYYSFLGLFGYYNHFNWRFITNPFNEDHERFDQEKRPYHVFENKSWREIVLSWRIIFAISSIASIPFSLWRIKNHVDFSFVNLTLQFVFIFLVLLATAMWPSIKQTTLRWIKSLDASIANSLYKKIDEISEKKTRKEQLKAEARKTAIAKLETERAPKSTKIIDIEELLPPEEKKTVRLRWNRLKNRVCKPFAGQ